VQDTIALEGRDVRVGISETARDLPIVLAQERRPLEGQRAFGKAKRHPGKLRLPERRVVVLDVTAPSRHLPARERRAHGADGMRPRQTQSPFLPVFCWR